ncbi:glycosyltransferase family 49 protein [Rhizophagus clarus]|uniref:Glycosyltransferase family 49 protein n=1 Tax=Rhizophagus clarus TaxID=94130 RepID=A0A8H3KTX4_9GLOM|nr:glycosyltransferase family 49 protein [Rhizophagus clarus]
MWWFNKSCSQLPGTTYVLRLLKSKLVKYILCIYMAFSILFSITQLVKYTFGNYGIYSSELLENQPIFRTYDTHRNSPLSEMTNKHRFSKIHAYSPHALTDSIHPYHIRAESNFNPEDVTVITFVTQNRLNELVRLAESWKGPISATLHIPSKIGLTDPLIVETINSIKKIYKKKPYLRKQVDIHLITGPSTSFNETLLPTPTNFHINVARFFARTEFIFFLDFDTWPTPETHSNIKRYADILIKNNVLILPTFVFVENVENRTTQYKFPKTKDDVIHLVNRHKLGLQDYGWEINSGPTCLDSWLKADKLFHVEEYELHYRPNFVARKGGQIPWCSERFDDNKAACIFEIYLSGAELYVDPDSFLIRHHFNRDSHLVNYGGPHWQKVINSRMYTNFSREICLLYVRTFVAMNLWQSPIANHVKQECQRVLASWGSGLIKNSK